jgi:hypothetical protein
LVQRRGGKLTGTLLRAGSVAESDRISASEPKEKKREKKRGERGWGGGGGGGSVDNKRGCMVEERKERRKEEKGKRRPWRTFSISFVTSNTSTAALALRQRCRQYPPIVTRLTFYTFCGVVDIGYQVSPCESGGRERARERG